MDKATFVKNMAEAAEAVKKEKGEGMSCVMCKITVPKWFPHKSLQFRVLFDRYLLAKDEATALVAAEEAWAFFDEYYN